jgi:hypothetical protein
MTIDEALTLHANCQKTGVLFHANSLGEDGSSRCIGCPLAKPTEMHPGGPCDAISNLLLDLALIHLQKG